ncbi:MAG: carboxypeptidase-like regulatory domain-containing protein, partial [Acidimicrobiia bacterium]|nr:carboxypeptidase-like regulatory domain-containing protein [Acidimicrobiia bacterium]
GSYDYSETDLVPCHYIVTFAADSYVSTEVPFEIAIGQPGEVTVDAVMRRKPRAALSVFVPTSDPNVFDFESGPTKFNLTTDPAVVASVIVDSPPNIVASVDAATNTFKFEVSVGGTTTEFLPVGPYAIRIIGAPGFTDNSVSFTLLAEQEANIIAPMSPVGKDFGGRIFYETPNGNDKPIPAPNVNIGATQVATGFDEVGGLPAAPFVTQRDDVAQTSTTVGATTTWDPQTLTGLYQVWDTASYAFTHPDFVQNAGAATVAITVIENGDIIAAASPEVDSVNVVGASGSQTVDVELLPLDGNLAGQVSVISVAPSTDVFGATGRVQVTIDGLEDAAAAFTRPVTTVPTVPPTAGLLTGSYTAINQSPGSYTADIQSANIVPVVGGTATSTVVLEPNDQAIFTQLDYYEEGRLIVEVLDQTGAPPPTLIQGATVSLAGTAFTATTGTDGRVSFTGIDVNGVVPLAPRPYTLQVEIDGFQPVTTQVQMLPGGFIDPLVPNTPDADGVFQITLLPLQTITGLVEAINDVGSTTAVPLSGATITYRFFTTADLDPCNATTGFVEDTVTSDGATTGPNFEIAGDEGFYYICEISAPGYTTFVNATPAQLVIGVATPGNETVPAGTFQLLGAPGNIIGKIINDNTSASLPNRELDGNSGRPAAVVCVLPAGFAVTNTPVSTCPVGTLFQDTADNSAEVSFNAIPATGYRLLVFATDHLPLVLDVTVGPGATVDLVDPPDGPIVLKRQKASITATVYAVNTDTGANQVSCTNAKVLGVLPSAAVTITGGDVAGVRGALTTNASGQFTLANLEDGTYDASIDPVDAGFGIVPFAETPVATITDQTDVIRTNLQSNTGNCPVLIPADDGTLSVVLFDDTNGNGVRDGAEGLISTAVAVTVEAFLPTDTVNPEASFNGTAAAGTGLVDNTADLPALSLTAANGTTDPNSPDDRYTIEVSPQTAGAFLSQPVTTEVTPGQLVTVEVGIFVGTRITGILQKQTGDSVTNPITSGDSAALVELFDGTAVSRGTAGPTAFDSSGRWSINVATSVAGAPDYTLVHSNGNNFITTVLSKTEVAALGSPLPGGTLDVGTVTLIERGTLDVSASIAGLTVRLDPLNLGSISPPPGFAVPLQSNGVTPLTALIDDNGTPGNTNDDFTYYELTMGAGQLAAAFKVDPRVNYDVTVSSPTVAPATRADVDVPVGGTTVVSFTLPATGNVVVTVLDPTGASSILDARVALLDAFGDEVANDNNANNSGVYVLNGIDPGTYDIRVTSNDFPDETFAAEVTNLLANETRNVTVTLTGGSITVNVAMLEGGTFPTAGFTLAIAGPTTHPNQTATPGSPNPVFTGLEDDSYTVSVVSPTTGYTYQFTPANARRTITDNNPDQSISLDVTVVRDVSVTLRQPDGLTALTTGTVTLEPGGLALTHTTGGVWTRSDVPIPPAASGDYDVKVLSAYPDETFAGVIDFTAPGAAVTATRTLTGGSVTVRVTTALAAQSYGVELDGATTETATITIAVAATSGEVTFTGLAKDTWTASITSAPAGWQTSTADDDAVVGATATTGSPIIFTAANPAPSVGTATSSEATVNDDPCATAPTSSTITVVNVTDVAGDSLTVTLGWTLGGTADSAAMTQSPTTATTYTGTFDPANFVADVTVTLTVTATDSNGGTDTSTVDVDLVATCPP